MLPLPDEHLGLGKWLHSALLRREKRILWLQTTLSVNILQLSPRLSDDKPHAARRAANLRPYGRHFIVIFHGRNVNGRCLPQPPLAAPLSTLKHGRRGARPACLLSPPTRARRPGPPSGVAHWGAEGPLGALPPLLFCKIRSPAANPESEEAGGAPHPPALPAPWRWAGRAPGSRPSHTRPGCRTAGKARGLGPRLMGLTPGLALS